VSKSGIKHMIKCRCILPTMKNRPSPPLHEFIVFSILNNENGEIFEKYVSCNNCGINHRVYDLCKSEIINNSESTKVALTIEDISVMLPDAVNNILKSYSRELPDYEHIKFMIDENAQDQFIVLSSEFENGRKSGKILKFKGNGKFEIEPFSRSEFIE